MQLRHVALLLWFTGCAGGAAATGAGAAPVARRGVPGFDTREYPGAAALEVWLRESPYRWVGYYLEAPCRPRSSWTGVRDSLARAGWGFAVIYVGEQQWADTMLTPVPPGGMPRCTRANLTAERGRADAIDAEERAAAEGFPNGTLIWLNVERVEQPGSALVAYIQSWVGTLHERGRFRPGLYVHERNADALYAHAGAELQRRGADTGPPLWVAKGAGFSLAAAPRESGYAAARIWQGVFDARETWGDVTLTIDANVADHHSPSEPRR